MGFKFMRDGFTNNLSEFSFIPESVLGHLMRHLPDGSDAQEVLQKSWYAAVHANFVADTSDHVSFPVWTDEQADYTALPNNGLVATLSKNQREDVPQPWALTYAGLDRRFVLDTLGDDVSTPRNLYDFAYIPWERILPDLAERALPEDWGFAGEDDFSILRSYFVYTYQRVAIQGKVLVDEKAGLAAFNSGLVTSAYDDIFVCFKPNPYRATPAWSYEGVCVAGEKGLGKRLVDSFAEVPKRATYFEDVNDLVFDSSQELYVDANHVVVDNLDRLPVRFLQRHLYDCPELLSPLGKIGQTDNDDAASYDALRHGLQLRPELLLRLRGRIEDAVRVAQKRTEWNYRTAVPCYHPKANAMSLLLPLYLDDSAVPEVALVVSISKSGAYQGETILTMRQAYIDARLICRPENDWLVAR